MSRPFCLFWALPEVYGVSVVSAEEGLYPTGEWNNNLLKGIDLGFEGFAGCSDRICNDNDFMSVFIVHGRNETDAHRH